MGVPSLFRWFEKKFPGVVRRPDPKLDTCDNLYVDANSIIHNACHPAHRPPPDTEEQMMVEIGAYLEHVIKTAKPTRLVFIAIDGVAPQAKILQQRTRRFRAAKEAAEMKEKKSAFMQKARENKITKYDKLANLDDWDSNVITPGTPFMAALDKWLHAWILRKFKTDPFFRPLTIILSGSAVPGEGEHKAMDFIRRQRSQPGYKPLKHAFYGPDADLILLALATHEPSFRILREDPREKHDFRCVICHSYDHNYKQCLAIPEDWTTLPMTDDSKKFTPPRLIFFDVWLLRICLDTYLKLPKLVVPAEEKGGKAFDSDNLVDLERAIDDFILLVALMGNDFLPGLPIPHWEIHEGAINTLVDKWKIATLESRGYIVKNGHINLQRLRKLFEALGPLEGFPLDAPDITARYPSEAPKKPSVTPDLLRGSSVASAGVRRPDSHLWSRPSTTPLSSRTNVMFDVPEGFPAMAEDSKPKVKKADGLFEEYSGTAGGVEEYEMFPTKSSYYERKLGKVQGSNVHVIHKMIRDYVEGLQWVMNYYCQGCPSWKWSYPFFYAPWPSDISNLGVEQLPHMSKGKPLPPLSQLMSVFPPASAEHVPTPYQPFMTDPASPLINYYPLSFEVDRNNKKQEWKAVVLLPPIDPVILQQHLDLVWNDLSKWKKPEDTEARKRNEVGSPKILICDNAQVRTLFQQLSTLYKDPRKRDRLNYNEALEYISTTFLAGTVAKDRDISIIEDINSQFNHAPGVEHIKAISCQYAPPAATKPHTCELLPGQPEVHFNYRLIARMKRDPFGLFHRPWAKGDNAGRDARAVAAELASGKKKTFHDWSKKFDIVDQEFPEEFQPLPHNFDGFVAPIFPSINEDMLKLADLSLEGEEDDEADIPTSGSVSGNGEGSRSSMTASSRTTVPTKRNQPPKTQYTSAGYARAPEIVVKDEPEFYGSDSSDDGAPKKQRTRYKKVKVASKPSAQQRVKDEPMDSDDDWI